MAHGLVGLIDKTAQFRVSYPSFSFAEIGIAWMTLAMPMTAAGFILARVALVGIAGGWLARRFLGRKWTLNTARKVSLLTCALAVLPVCFAPFAPSVLLAVMIVGLAGAAHQGWWANLYSVVSDTMPKTAISSVIGLGGFLNYFTGGFVNGITGQQKTGNYVPVFAYSPRPTCCLWGPYSCSFQRFAAGRGHSLIDRLKTKREGGRESEYQFITLANADVDLPTQSLLGLNDAATASGCGFGKRIWGATGRL